MDDDKSTDEQLNGIYRGHNIPACIGPHEKWTWHTPTDTMRCVACFRPMDWTETMRRLRAFDKLMEENKVLWAVLKAVGVAVPSEN